MTLRRTALAAALAAMLYVPGTWWGGPAGNAPHAVRSWGVDDETPLGPLAQIHNIMEPAEVQNLGYPLLHSFVVAGAYAPYLAWLWIRGEFDAPTGSYPFGLSQPATSLPTLGWIASLVSVLLAIGVVVAAMALGRTLGDERTGWLAGALMAVSYPMFYYSRTGNVDMLMLCMSAVAIVVYARIIAGGFTVRRAVVLGVAVGGAVATKEPAAALFLAMPPVLLMRQLQQLGGLPSLRTRPFWEAPLVAAAACFLAFGIGSGWFVDPTRFYAHLAFIGGRLESHQEGAVAFATTYPFTLEGHARLAMRLTALTAAHMTWVGFGLAMVGVAWVFRDRRRDLLVLLPALTYALVLFWAARIGMLRYLMPVAFVLIPFQAYALRRLLARTASAISRGTGRLLVIGLLVVGLLRGVDLTQEMFRDSRYAAAVWLRYHLPTGAHIEFFGADQKLPTFRDDVRVERAIAYQGAAVMPPRDPETARSIEARWREQPPDAILVIPDHSTLPGEAHSASFPPTLYGRLEGETLGYVQSEVFHTARWFPWLLRPTLDYPTVNPRIRIFTRTAPPVPSSRGSGLSQRRNTEGSS